MVYVLCISGIKQRVDLRFKHLKISKDKVDLKTSQFLLYQVPICLQVHYPKNNNHRKTLVKNNQMKNKNKNKKMRKNKNRINNKNKVKVKYSNSKDKIEWKTNQDSIFKHQE